MLEVELLGKFEVRRDGKLITISSRPAQSLFAYLILSAGTPHRREKLAGLLWPDSTEEGARDYLRHALWRVRKAIDAGSSKRNITSHIIADDISVSFNAAASYNLDTALLGQLDPESASIDQLTGALAHYTGELLPGFYDEWVLFERGRVQALFEQKVGRLLERLEVELRWPEILLWAEKWISFGQKPEAAYRALMIAHAALGEMSKIAVTFERCARSLRDLGMEPSEQTRELYESLKAGEHSLKWGPTSAKAHAEQTGLSNIPVPLTSFIGRERELKEIGRLLSTSRLLTLTGAGGVGKTRLAIATARLAAAGFKDGVFWVGLVGLSDASLIAPEMARALNVRELADEPLIETIKRNLGPRELLLVLDNCEHLIKACAAYAEQLLAACPALKILATSIEGLGLFNETIWQVPSLPLPGIHQHLSLRELRQFASVELFGERAGNARPDFSLSEKNAATVGKICNRLDGIPLAIELAAARIKVLSVDEIAAHLDDRFTLLTSGSRTAIPRHQTLRATIDWSHDLLTESERILFRRLAVFAGGFTLEAAEAVCTLGELERGAILDLLGRLVDKSLVVVDREAAAGESRYHLLETIREYAREKLAASGEVAPLRDRHLDFYLVLAERSEPYTYGRDAPIWFGRLEQELDNIRSAIEWSTDHGKATVALRVLSSLVYFWFARGHLGSEWDDRMHQALSRPESQEGTPARAKALNSIGFMFWTEDVNPTDKRPEIEEALAIGRQLGDRWNIAAALCNLGLLANIQGNYAEARSSLEQSLAMWREMGPEGNIGKVTTLNWLGDAILNLDGLDQARSIYQESAALLRERGDMNFLAYALRRLAQLAWREGEHEKAMALCSESLNLNQTVGDPRGVAACLAGFGAIATAQGKLQRAAQLMAATETALRSFGIRLLYMDKLEFARNLELLRANMDQKSLDKCWAKGNAMTLGEAIAFALART